VGVETVRNNVFFPNHCRAEKEKEKKKRWTERVAGRKARKKKKNPVLLLKPKTGHKL